MQILERFKCFIFIYEKSWSGIFLTRKQICNPDEISRNLNKVSSYHSESSDENIEDKTVAAESSILEDSYLQMLHGTSRRRFCWNVEVVLRVHKWWKEGCFSEIRKARWWWDEYADEQTTHPFLSLASVETSAKFINSVRLTSRSQNLLVKISWLILHLTRCVLANETRNAASYICGQRIFVSAIGNLRAVWHAYRLLLPKLLLGFDFLQPSPEIPFPY